MKQLLLVYVLALCSSLQTVTCTVFLSLSFTTNSTLECSTGLVSHSAAQYGVSLLVEYRLVDDLPLTQWQLLSRVHLNHSEAGGTIETTSNVSSSQCCDSSDTVQLRIVQSEHGGGSCNCWGVILNEPIISTNAEPCASSQLDCSDCRIQFCGGSASVPRGVVLPPMSLSTGRLLDCVAGSTVVDSASQLTPASNCLSHARMDISFQLYVSPGNCVPRWFDEGVEVSIGNWDNNGQWIPLLYAANSQERSPERFGIDIGAVNESTVKIRGYDVPYYVQHDSLFNFSVCDDVLLRSGVQIRWLQTTSIFISDGYIPRDIVTLSNISIIMHTDQENSIVLLSDGLETYSLRNSEVLSEFLCTLREVSSLTTGVSVYFGALCTTKDCELQNQQIIVSRTVTTPPLNISSESISTTFVQQPSTTSPLLASIKPTLTQTQRMTKMPAATTSSNDFTSSVFIQETSTPFPDTYLIYARKELQSTTLDTLFQVSNNTSFARIKNLPPANAAVSLNRLVDEDVQIPTTILAYLICDIVNRTGTDELQLILQSLVQVIDQLISRTANSLRFSTIAGSTVLANTERITFKALPPGNSIGKANIELLVLETEANTDDQSSTLIGLREHSIQVPAELVREVANGTGPVTMAAVYYRNMSGLLPGTLPGENGSVLASPVVSTSLQCGREICDTTANIQLNQPVIVTLKHSEQVQALIENDNTSNVTCVFWDFITVSDSPLSHGRWDTEGCVRNEELSNSSQTVCECTHLTNFAILLSARPLNLPSAVALSLEIIGYIGVSLSVIAMLATILALLFLRSLWSMRNFIHINLCVSLILAQLTFVIGVTPHEGGGSVVGPGCQTAAVLMHYLFLVSFMWMLMEGVVLYVALVKVFVKHQRRYMIGFFLFSYGAPLLYMILCVPLGFTLPHLENSYGYIQENNGTTAILSIVCWLSPYNGFVFSFIVPVVAVITVNAGFFIMAVTIMYRHSNKEVERTRMQRAKYWLKSSVSLTTVMGLTWIIGVLVFEVDALLPLAYIFTIFVAFQGVAIFVIFIPLSKQVREAYSKWWKVKVAESDILSKHFGDSSYNSSSKSGSFKTSRSSLNTRAVKSSVPTISQNAT